MSVQAPGLLANDSDPDLPDDSLQVLIETPPLQGQLNLHPDGSLVYTPTLNFNGPITFSYQTSDGELLSPVAVVTLSFDTANDPPVAAADLYSGLEDQPLSIQAPGLLANDRDIDFPGDMLTAVLVSAPSQGQLDLLPDGSFVYTPALDFNGPITFSYQVSDGQLLSSNQLVRLVVEALNDAPRVLAGSDQVVEEGQALQFAGEVFDPDSPVQAAGIAWDFGDGSPAVTGILTPTHSYRDQGTYTVTLTVTDTLGGAASDRLQVSVSNAAPLLGAFGNQQAQLGEMISISGSFNDPGEADTHQALIQWMEGVTQTLFLQAGELEFQADYLYMQPGIYTVVVTVMDKDGAASQQSFTVTITAPPAPGPHLYLPLIRR